MDLHSLGACHARELPQQSDDTIKNPCAKSSTEHSSWLLHCLDRVSGDEIATTHELIATMLGVRREGITHAASTMRDRGVLSYFRGHIKVLNRAKLEAAACECYAVIAHEYGRLLPSNATFGTRAGLTSALRAPGIPALRMASQAFR